MKLVYIAHGWYLALTDRDLFSNRIEAWKFGPVIPDLYHATKSFGRNPIPLSRITDDPSKTEKSDNDFLVDVYKKYGHLDGIQLSSMTHQSGTPWDMVYVDGANGEITDSLIKDHYLKLLRQHAESSSSAA